MPCYSVRIIYLESVLLALNSRTRCMLDLLMGMNNSKYDWRNTFKYDPIYYTMPCYSVRIIYLESILLALKFTHAIYAGFVNGYELVYKMTDCPLSNSKYDWENSFKYDPTCCQFYSTHLPGVASVLQQYSQSRVEWRNCFAHLVCFFWILEIGVW